MSGVTVILNIQSIFAKRVKFINLSSASDRFANKTFFNIDTISSSKTFSQKMKEDYYLNRN